jgi:hypothetical protein
MKGSMMDIIIMGVTLLVLAISILVASLVMGNFQASTVDTLTTAGAQAALTQGAVAVNTFNYGFIVIAIGLGLGGLIFAWLVPTHPIFIIVSVIMLLIGVVVLPVLSNAFETVSTDATMSTATSNFPLMVVFMSNLPLIGTVFGVLMIIVLYTRYQNSGTQ